MADGEGCKCFARNSGDCVCGADWSCGECAKLRADVEKLTNEVSDLRSYGKMCDESLASIREIAEKHKAAQAVEVEG